MTGLGRLLVAGLCGAAMAMAPLPALAETESQRVVVIVNDQPITDFDVTQRLRLNQALGYGRGAEQSRKQALNDVIDDVVKQAEAKKNKVEPTDKQIDAAIERLAKNSGTTPEGLAKSLQGKGVSLSTLKRHVGASIAFNWIMTKKYNIKVEADQAEVDRRFTSITNDPRLKPVDVYEIIEIQLPVEGGTEAMMEQLMYARAIEAQQIIQRYKGCGTIRQAASGIYNVKIGRPVQAPGDKLPAQMRNVLNKSGTAKLIGPMRGKNGVQLVGFCGRKTISPPKPSRELVEEVVKNEKYKVASDRILRDLRRTALIDYRDTSYTQ